MTLSIAEANTLIRTCREIAESPDPVSKLYAESVGICANLTKLTGTNSYLLVAKAGVTWPLNKLPGKFIPNPVPTTPQIWKGEGLTFRIDFLNHIADFLSTAVKEAEDNGLNHIAI